MITLNNVDFKYSKSKKEIFKDFSLSIPQGSICGLLGKNGAGKSTLLYLLAGLLSPQKGVIEFDGNTVSKRLPSTLREIFIVPEEFDLPTISLKRYVQINSTFYPNFDEGQLNKYLECFEMSTDVNLGALSMGQKKKVFMSFALATNTSLLVMDEPTNGLDIPGKSQFRKFVTLGMTQGKTILISTHQVQDVDKLLDHIIILDNNTVLLDKSVAGICDALCFVESYSKEDIERSLFAMPSLQGNSLIIPKRVGDEETPINLEVLFNASIAQDSRVNTLLNNQ